MKTTPIIQRLRQNRSLMIGFAVLCFVIALVSGIVGFGGLAAAAVMLAKLGFFVFLVLFVASLLIPFANEQDLPSVHGDPAERERAL